MSYRAEISFKTIDSGSVFAFFRSLKEKVGQEMDGVAKENFIYAPSVRYCIKDKEEARKANKKWAEDVFRWRWFYLEEHNLLGVYGVPNCVKSLFDANCFFQNSCDQNYEFHEWNGVPVFEEIATKWQNCSQVDVQKAYYDEYGEVLDEEDIEREKSLGYWRKSMCYREIWGMIEHFLFDEESVVYLSLYGYYDVAKISIFVALCQKHYEEWCSKIELDSH